MPDYRIKGNTIFEMDWCESFIARGGCGCLCLLFVLVLVILLIFDGVTYGDWTINLQDAQATATAVVISQGTYYSEEAGNALLRGDVIKLTTLGGSVFVHPGPTGTITFNDITVKHAGEYTLTAYYEVSDEFSVQMTVNNGNSTLLSFVPGLNSSPSSLTVNVILVAGTNKIEFSHAKGSGNTCPGTFGSYCDTFNGITLQLI